MIKLELDPISNGILIYSEINEDEKNCGESRTQWGLISKISKQEFENNYNDIVVSELYNKKYVYINK